MAGERITVPVSTDTVTVLGSRWKADAPAWRGLDFTRAIVRTQNTLSLALFGPDEKLYDLHLDVPFMHPDDQARGDDEWLKYRVRPRAESGKRWRGRLVKSVALIPAEGQPIPWAIEIEYAGKGRQASESKVPRDAR